MWIRFSLYLLLVFCALARSDESPHQKQREDGQNEDQPPYIILPSYGLFQRQPVMMGRNNLAFLLSATTTTITTTSTSTCTFSTAAQCIGRRRRELAIEELADVADLNL